MAGFFLNSYPLICTGKVRLYRLPAGRVRPRRYELRDELGVAVWIEGSDVFMYEEPRNGEVELIDRPLAPVDELSLFAIREAMVAHCHRLDFEASIVRAGELRIVGAIPAATEDCFRIEPVLKVRVNTEEFVDTGAVLTARQRTAWRSAAPLIESDVATQAPGEWAVRVNGDGPRRGRVLNVTGSTAILRCGEDEVEVLASEYVLAVNAALIARWRGPAVLRRVRITAGDLTIRGKRNQHGIADRFKLVGDAVRRLGGNVPVGPDGALEIAARPIQVRLEANA